ncbi:metalloregulator ArsR/SmtB family transcription factor [Rhizobium sp. S153]|uniref:Metalloregulator ArsR/SmtB family transcription factor n=1 Tax=Ciceribacter sichuanensis TaxID=2949647 RepID=A0ABT0V7J8_9HYPH|nr:metalloregulator ArsR/SmtB family transcription factor [Ciceribacter sp. S153]MCM2401829.1 metalloregulator ArsR/SmtB family transcription factor [Ciceribacter sp. S153]
MPSGNPDFKPVLAALSALGHEGRLSIIRLLARHAPAGLNAGDIGERLGIRANTLSTNLTVLTNAGLISGERAGRHIRYRVEAPLLRQVAVSLMKDCCSAAPELRCPVFEETANRNPAGRQTVS